MKIRPELEALLSAALASNGLIVYSKDINLLIRHVELAKQIEPAYKALSCRTFDSDMTKILLIPRFILERKSNGPESLRAEDLIGPTLFGKPSDDPPREG